MSSPPQKTLHQAHPWHGLSPHASSNDAFHAYIEIVPTDTVKYELHKETGHLCIDRPQQFSSQCPSLYGFVPQTLCAAHVAQRASERCSIEQIDGDGDPMDVCVLTEKTISHGGFVCRFHPIGGLRMIDGDEADDKIIGVLDGDLTYGSLRELEDCPKGVIERLHHYFINYKQRPDKPTRHVRIAEIYGRAEALEMLQRSIKDYGEHWGEK